MEERVCFGLQFEGTVNCGEKGMGVLPSGMWDWTFALWWIRKHSWAISLHPQLTLTPVTCFLHKSQALKGSTASKNSVPAGKQVFKHRTLWRTFYLQTLKGRKKNTKRAWEDFTEPLNWEIGKEKEVITGREENLWAITSQGTNDIQVAREVRLEVESLLREQWEALQGSENERCLVIFFILFICWFYELF